MTLSQLQKSNPNRYNTDKGDAEHSFAGQSYLNRYDVHFPEIKDDDGDILEIGISFGGSLRLWRDYFTKGKVFGMDIRDLSEFCPTEGRIVTIIGDQSNQDDLRKIKAMSGGFKLIVDDGTHTADDILNSFHWLWPALKSGGWYVMEDLRLPIDWGTYDALAAKFSTIAEMINRMEGDIQALIHYPMVTMIQKA